MDGVRKMTDGVFLPQTTGMKVMDERKETDETGKKNLQVRKHLPLPESFPQPLKAGGIKVKTLD